MDQICGTAAGTLDNTSQAQIVASSAQITPPDWPDRPPVGLFPSPSAGYSYAPSQPPLDLPWLMEEQVTETISTDLGASDAVNREPYPRLPPLEEIEPLVESYFTNVNAFIPLFSRPAFTRMLDEYYTFTCRRPRITWAAVNVVLALATRLPASPSNDLDLGAGDKRVAKYLNNVQSCLAELVSGNVELLDLQVLLGLVILFNGLKDSRTAVVLVGTAVRLAHRLRLHSRYQRGQEFSPDEALQRNRVFWISYLFDRDICLRHHTPAVQDETDIDVDFPPENPSDGAGNVYASGGQVVASFFRLRLQLAHIQGRLYTMLFSNRAAKASPHERRARVALLHDRLERWRATLPSELQADVVAEHVDRPARFWLCMMHFSYLACLVMTHGIWSHDAQWRKRLAAGLEAGRSGALADPPLPSGWKNCVRMSRHCMAMIAGMPLSDSSVW